MYDAISYPFAEPPADGKAMWVAPDIKWVRLPLPLALNHINVYLLAIDEGWILVDTGIGGEVTQQHWEWLFENELEGKPLVAVLATHMHPDHLGQAGWITDKFRIPLYMTLGEYMTARTFSGSAPSSDPWIMRKFMIGAGYDQDYLDKFFKNRGRGFNSLMEPMPNGYIRIKDGDQLHWGESPWQVVVGEGHSPEHASLLNSARNIMFTGDQVIATISSNISVIAVEPEANPLRLWLQSLEDFKKVSDETLCLPSHGLPFYGLHFRLNQLIQHHEDHLTALTVACEEPKTCRELLPVLFKRELGPNLIGLAVGECIAHLHCLMDRLVVDRLEDSAGVYRYQTNPEHVGKPRLQNYQQMDAPFYV